MNVLRKLFAAILDKPLSIETADSDKVVASIDIVQLITVTRHASFEGNSIKVFVGKTLVYGYGYEHLKPKDHEEIAKFFSQAIKSKQDTDSKYSKIAQDWFSRKFIN